jgi:precorrin-3B synthase
VNMLATKDFPRRGACPGLSKPMATGDGLLVRFSPRGTIPLSAFGAFSEAAKAYGNGIIEVTARGNIQVRGLSAASAPAFADAIAALGIAAEDGIPILCNPLAGLDPNEVIDVTPLTADLRQSLARSSPSSRIGPKVSIVIDGGGTYRLNVAADIRMGALADGRSLGIEVAGRELGSIAVGDAVAAVTRLLDVLARRGRLARARDVILAEGVTPFRKEIADLITSGSTPPPAATGEIIGFHQLRDGSIASGIALPFGHADAASLQQLTNIAKAAGACGFRTAPERVLLAIGLQPEALEKFTSSAKSLGFIVDAADPRRYVIACAGAPVCASAHIAARAIGPAIAMSAASYLGDKFSVHVSGCAKGCAHPAPAALTIVGTEAGCGLVAEGSARDTPFMTAATNELTGKIESLIRNLKGGAGHG